MERTRSLETPRVIKLNGETQRAVLFGLSDRIITNRNRKHGQIIYASMGKGKTFMTVAFAQNYIGMQIVVFVPGIAGAWVNQILDVVPGTYVDSSDSKEKVTLVPRTILPGGFERDTILASTDIDPSIIEAVVIDNNQNSWVIIDHTNLMTYVNADIAHGRGNDGNPQEQHERLSKYLEAKKGTRAYVFDEAHQLQSLVSDPEYTSNPQPWQMAAVKHLVYCRFSLLLTGTLIYNSPMDILFSVNLAGGLPWKIPFDITDFKRQYYHTSTYRKVFHGWMLSLLVMQVGGFPLISKIFDILDFYANHVDAYNKSKKKVVVALLSMIPFFNKKVATLDPHELLSTQKMTPFLFASMMLYFGMMTPFSFMIPAILGLMTLNSQRDMYSLDKEKFFGAIEPYIQFIKIKYVKNRIRTKLSYALSKVPMPPMRSPLSGLPYVGKKMNLVRDFSRVSTKTMKPLNSIQDPLVIMDIHSVQVKYSYAQARTFTRLSVGRHTPTEMRMMGMASNAESALRAGRLPTPKDLRTFGLCIGNLSYDDAALEAINKEADAYKKDYEQYAELIQTTYDATIVHRTQKSEERGGTSPASSTAWKFEFVIDKIKNFTDANNNLKWPTRCAKTVIYSMFVERGLTLIYNRLVSSHVGIKPDLIGWYLKKDTIEGLLATFSGASAKDKNYETIGNNIIDELVNGTSIGPESVYAKSHPAVQGWARMFQRNVKKWDHQAGLDLVLKGYASGSVDIIMLDPEFTEGVDGIKNTTTMHILEPLESYSKLSQLRARVVRTGSHDNPDTRVHVYEYRMSMWTLAQTLALPMEEWAKNQAAGTYHIREKFFSQSTTPDEVVFREQRKQAALESEMDEYLAKHPQHISNSNCVPWLPRDDDAKADSDKKTRCEKQTPL